MLHLPYSDSHCFASYLELIVLIVVLVLSIFALNVIGAVAVEFIWLEPRGSSPQPYQGDL